MGILLAFTPFIVFVIVERLFSVPAGLAAGAITSAALLLRDLISRDRQVKVLEIGTVILFAGLTAYALMAGSAWSIAAVRLRVDGGLLLIVLASMAIRRPFTLQYAREQVSRELWQRPEFLRTNYVITAAWAVAFAVMVVADLVLIYAPDLPRSLAIIVTVAALYAAIKFTGWYPEHQQAVAGAK